MALQFYLAGEADNDRARNWRSSITDQCYVDGALWDAFEYDHITAASLIRNHALPGGFDYVGAYIFYHGHDLYSFMDDETAFVSVADLHRASIQLCDVLWAWIPGCGAGTWAEIGYAAALGKPIIFADHNVEPIHHEEFTFQFARGRKWVAGGTAREAWDIFAAMPMKYMNYDDYLRTPHWQRIRQAMYEEVPKLCQRCGSNKNVQLHHLTYERVGREAWGDLVPLCSVCHQREHALAAQP